MDQESRQSWTVSSAQGRMRLESKCWPGCILISMLDWLRVHFQVHSGYWQNLFSCTCVTFPHFLISSQLLEAALRSFPGGPLNKQFTKWLFVSLKPAQEISSWRALSLFKWILSDQVRPSVMISLVIDSKSTHLGSWLFLQNPSTFTISKDYSNFIKRVMVHHNIYESHPLSFF